jgi:hypothetical protein
MRNSLPSHFIPSSREEVAERLRRGVYPLVLTLVGSFSLNSILQHKAEPPPQRTVVKAYIGSAQGYPLRGRYDGLTAFENIESATVSISETAHDRVPTYHFDLFNRLAFEGEHMFDVDEGRIQPALREDFAHVKAAFCARYKTYEPLEPAGRFNAVCHAPFPSPTPTGAAP